MIDYDISIKGMKELFPVTYKNFLEELRNSKSKHASKVENRIKWIFCWGVYYKEPFSEKEIEKEELEHSKDVKLIYEKRYKKELRHLKLDVSIIAGSYVKTDESFDPIPSFVIELFSQLLKITMLKEQEVEQDPIVMESLKEFEYLLDDVIEYDIDGNIIDKKELNIDEILDKISKSKNGIKSLTAKEIKFLNEKSKKE